MSGLADKVLPLIRTRADLHRAAAANAHGRQVHQALALLQQAAETDDPSGVVAVAQRAVDSAVTVILRADDSSGIIGDATRGLLDLHAKAARKAPPPPSTLVKWLIKFQFDGRQDFFTIDPVDYAPALGETGLARYRSQLEQIAERLGPEPEKPTFPAQLADPDGWERAVTDWHTRFALAWNERRLAVLDRDVDAIIRTHARDRKVAAWLHETAQALAEIGQVDLAIDWAKQAADFDRGHQAKAAAAYWCQLLASHYPDRLVAARLDVFGRWPDAGTAADLYHATGPGWPKYRDQVMRALTDRPREAVAFTLDTLDDRERAWNLAHSLAVDDADLWRRLVDAYEHVDPLAVLPVLARLVDGELQQTGPRHYKVAARDLRRMRHLAAGTDKAAGVDDHIASLRRTHQRRPRLQREFDRAQLPA